MMNTQLSGNGFNLLRGLMAAACASLAFLINTTVLAADVNANGPTGSSSSTYVPLPTTNIIQAAGVSYGQQVTRTVAGRDFTWQFNCGGGDCAIGKFIGGDFWVAPKTKGEAVVITSVTPEGEDNGLMANPVLSKMQSFLSCSAQSKFYDNSTNNMINLPFSVPADTSLVKAARKDPSKPCWGTSTTNNCCIDSYDVLTVLGAPLSSSATAFRPGFAGSTKTIYRLEQFDLKRIPSVAAVGQYRIPPNFEEIGKRWHTPYVDHFMHVFGDAGRAYAPKNVISDYGAEQNAQYLEDLLYVMGPATLDKKKPAITGLIQRGIDLYASYKAGVIWPSGAGQQMGRKPPMAFFASLIKDDKVRLEISLMAAKNGNFTQEDGQIRNIPSTQGGGGIPVWGDAGSQCNENNYWNQLLFAQKYAGGSGIIRGSGDNKRTCGDPYGWIDGPAGEPGTFYMSCCSTGGYIAYSLAQNLMPQLCTVANDPDLNNYVRRVLNKGIHTKPDVCAPPDPNESSTCAPYKDGAGCLYYKKTWGPDPKNPGRCIVNGTNGTKQSGRFPDMDGTKFKISNEGGLALFLRGKLGVAAYSTCKP